jgi:hypothetical protein
MLNCAGPTGRGVSRYKTAKSHVDKGKAVWVNDFTIRFIDSDRQEAKLKHADRHVNYLKTVSSGHVATLIEARHIPVLSYHKLLVNRGTRKRTEVA